MLTSSSSTATVEPTPGDTDPAGEEIVLQTITELAARWHRHAADTGDQFVAGMRNGWAQAISLLLDVDSRAVLAALEAGAL